MKDSRVNALACTWVAVSDADGRTRMQAHWSVVAPSTPAAQPHAAA